MTNSLLRDLEVAVRLCIETYDPTDPTFGQQYEQLVLLTGQVYWYDTVTTTISATAPVITGSQAMRTCLGKMVDIEVKELCDTVAGVATLFYRAFTFTIEGADVTVTIQDFDESGVAYVPSGTVAACVELRDWTPVVGIATSGAPVTVPQGAVSYSITNLSSGLPDQDSIALTGAVVGTLPPQIATYEDGDEVNEGQLSADLIVTPQGTATAFVAYKTL